MYREFKVESIEAISEYTLAKKVILSPSLRCFSCDQAALRTLLSVRPSVCPPVTHLSQCSCHHIIMTFSGVITIDKSDVHAKGQGRTSKVTVTELKPNFAPGSFRIVTPVWIPHTWLHVDAQSLQWHRRCPIVFRDHPSNFKVKRAKKR